ncbi:hypothetical protein BDM02DRAFT_3088537 [Thelephora ganbajun]|uniref:Uncharacterized protein n=1 Tax=Thelephora ganbajun TaxID=370292 RepID=A0ACB6ZT59_THEGA|nr:hypothetical protein BDM02DRAFT_3088537 [Thelephora ganbajun]
MNREPSTVPPSNPIFRFNRETYSIKIENIAEQATRQTILDLFQSMIGEVRKCDEHVEAGKPRSMDLTFSSRDAFMKSLCMSGYTVAGVPITVTALSVPANNRLLAGNRQTDTRRNLYVLGLPFDLVKSEFVEIFSRYGRVSHAVILATIDNASRRRGFIVMSTHAEARLALSSLSRTEIKGHVIDVSWAVVQRSQGFLDGGDRSTALPPSVMPPSPAEKENSPENVLTENSPKGAQSFVVSIAVTSTLLIKNLPLLLFSQPSELEPLLLPFGQIKKLDILETSGTDTATGFITIAVEYATADSAYEAKMTLDGQVYVNDVLKIEFVQPVPSACDTLTAQAPRFPPVDSPSPLQALRRPPLVKAPYSYNSKSAGMTTPTNGSFAVNMGIRGPVSSSAPTTPYPFSAGSGMSYFASVTPLFDGRLDNVRPLARFADA